MAAGMLLNSHFPHATKITKPVLWVTGDSDQFHSVQQSQVLLYGLCFEAFLLLPKPVSRRREVTDAITL
jgi:hypothetical protein